MAVVQAGSRSSNWTPILGTSMCHRCGAKKKKDSLAPAIVLNAGSWPSEGPSHVPLRLGP